MSHPGYNHPDYRQARAVIQANYKNGTPLHCHIAGAFCTGYAQVAHHIVPLLQGGAFDASNLQPACRRCNKWLADANRRKSIQARNRRRKHPPFS